MLQDRSAEGSGDQSKPTALMCMAPGRLALRQRGLWSVGAPGTQVFVHSTLARVYGMMGRGRGSEGVR
eukprot:14439000-Alexandrium_andersonii.AAC.1